MTTENVAIIKEFDIAIKLDDGVVLGYEIEHGEILLYTEGIIREVCQELGDSIKSAFDIVLADFGIAVIEDTITTVCANNINYKHNKNRYING